MGRTSLILRKIGAVLCASAVAVAAPGAQGLAAAGETLSGRRAVAPEPIEVPAVSLALPGVGGIALQPSAFVSLPAAPALEMPERLGASAPALALPASPDRTQTPLSQAPQPAASPETPLFVGLAQNFASSGLAEPQRSAPIQALSWLGSFFDRSTRGPGAETSAIPGGQAPVPAHGLARFSKDSLGSSRLSPASIDDARNKMKWGENSWRYRLSTVFGAGWEIAYQVPGVNLLAQNSLVRRGIAARAPAAGLATAAAILGIGGAMILGMPHLAVLMWALASAPIFAAAHKDKTPEQRVGLMLVGGVLAAALAAPALFGLASHGGAHLGSELALGAGLNLALHSAYNAAVLALKSRLGRAGRWLTPASISGPAAAQAFIKEVIEPVSGALPPAVAVSLSPEGSVSIVHRQQPGGRTLDYQYKVSFAAAQLKAPAVSVLNAPNAIEVPDGPWDAEMVQELQNAWRRVTIGDPLLNRRFSNPSVEATPYQVEAVAKGLESVRAEGHALEVMATGAGKTFVAFEMARRILDQRRSNPLDGEDPGVVLFFVNNRTILSEAEEKLHQYYPGRYRTGRIYEGEISYDEKTDFIFATPLSLLSTSQNLETLLRKRKVAAVVVDEVHHLPAATNRMIFRRIQEEGRGTAFLGFTATEVRPDRASVIGFFGDRIAYEYPVTRGWHEGYLTPISYVSGDADILRRLGLDPAKVRLLDEGSELQQQFRRLLYDDSRFPDLLKLYRGHSQDNPDHRALVLAPNIERAQALTAYLNGQGVAAVTLTSADRQRDPVWFDHAYKAWKNGRWPQDSPYAAQPVPQVVLAVDLFREGTDVPAINLVILWGDTDSSIRFAQGIGRGLRPAPYKTVLRVIDAAGLYRKVKVLKFLGGLSVDPRQREEHKDDGERPVAKQAALALAPGGGIAFGDDVTHTIESYYGDVPARLDSRYGSYPLIPFEELKALDEYLAGRLGHAENGKPSVAKLNDALGQLSGELVKSPAPEALKAMRRRLIPAFFSADDLMASDFSSPVMVWGESLIVYHRLKDLLQRANPELTTEQLHRLFPEFNPQRRDALYAHGANLKALRGLAFGLTHAGMTKRLVDNYLKEHGSFKEERDLGDMLEDFRAGVAAAGMVESTLERFLARQRDLVRAHSGEDVDMYWAEAVKDPHLKDEVAAIGVSRQYRSVSVDAFIMGIQERLTEAYLQDPLLQGKLQSSDFELPREQFVEKLFHLGVVASTRRAPVFFKLLTDYVAAYGQAAKNGQKPALEAARQELSRLLAGGIAALPEAQDLREQRLTQLKAASDAFDAARAQLSERQTPEDQSLREAFDRVLEQAGLRRVVSPADMPGMRIEVEKQSGDANFRVAIHSEGSELKPSFFVTIRKDLFDRPHVFLLSRKDRQLIPDIAAMETFYASLPQTKRQDLIEELLQAVFWASDSAGPQAVYVLPEDPRDLEAAPQDPRFFADFLKAFLDPDLGRGVNILGPLQRVTTSPNSGADMKVTDSTEQSSRIPELSVSQLATVRARLSQAAARIKTAEANNQFAGMTYGEKLAEIYLNHYNYWNEFHGEWGPVRSRLDSYPADGHAAAQAQSLRRRMMWTMQRFGRDYYYLDRLRGSLDILKGFGDGQPVMAGEINLAALRLMTAPRYKDNVLRQAVGRLTRSYRLLLAESRRGGIPEDYLEIVPELDDFADRAVKSYPGGQEQYKVMQWLKSSAALAAEADSWTLKLDAIRNRFFPQPTAELEEDAMAAARAARGVSTKAQEGTIYRVNFEGGKLQLFVTGLPQPGAKKGRGKAVLPVAHIDPHCQAISQSSDGAKKIGADHLHDEVGKYSLCKICNHGLPGYRAGTPPYMAWGDIEKRYSKHGLDLSKPAAIEPAASGQTADEAPVEDEPLFTDGEPD